MEATSLFITGVPPSTPPRIYMPKTAFSFSRSSLPCKAELVVVKKGNSKDTLSSVSECGHLPCTCTHTHHTHVRTLQRSEELSSCWTRTQLSAAIPAGYEATSSQWANQAPTAFTRSAGVLLCTTTVHTLKSRFRMGSWLSKATRWKRRQSTVVRCACSDCLRTPGRRGSKQENHL